MQGLCGRPSHYVLSANISTFIENPNTKLWFLFFVSEKLKTQFRMRIFYKSGNLDAQNVMQGLSGRRWRYVFRAQLRTFQENPAAKLRFLDLARGKLQNVIWCKDSLQKCAIVR